MKKSNKGFTLMEMLIVVAIIAVLAAIMIPVFNGALTKAKESADIANIRACYAEWQTKILTENETVPATTDAFLKLNGNTVTLNYPKIFTTDGKGAFTYTAVKTAGTPFKWTLSQTTIS